MMNAMLKFLIRQGRLLAPLLCLPFLLSACDSHRIADLEEDVSTEAAR